MDMWLGALKKALRQARRRIANTCITTQFLLSTAHGLFPYNYNAETHLLTTNKWLSYYWPLANALIVLVIIYTDFIRIIATEIDFIAGKPLNSLLAYIHRIFSLSALFMVITKNWFGRHEFLMLHNALFEMHKQQQRWQQTWSMQTNRQIEAAFFQNYLIAKSVMTLLQMTSNICGKLGINPNPTLGYVFYVLLLFVVKNVTLLTVANFYIALLKVCQQLQQLNWNFKEIVWLKIEGPQEAHNTYTSIPIEDSTTKDCEMKYSMTESAPPVATQERGSVGAAGIAELCRQYVLIWYLAQSVYKLFEWQVLFFLVVMLYGNVMSIFYYLVYLGGKVMPKDLFSPALFPQICLINILDLYCFMVMCEQATTLAKETSFMMKELCQLKGLPVEIEYDLEMLSIFMASETRRFRFCGLFEWNFQAGASFMTATILYLVVLVQFDYENL